MWNILCYVSAGGKNDVQKTYDDGNQSLKAGLEVALDYLKIRQKNEWIRPSAAKMNKCDKYRDFYEIRFFSNNTQQRPIGFFGPNTNDFTILLWATEKGNRLNPDSWCTQAFYRMKQITDNHVKPVKLILDIEG